jgi:hypothetical protein
MARKREDTVKLVLRLPPPLHRQLTRAANRNNQSLNSEMIQRLALSFRIVWVGTMVKDAARKAAEGAQERSAEKLGEAADLLRRAATVWSTGQDDGEKT